MRKIIASLDIGSSTIKLIVGEFIKNSFSVLCISEVPSRGIKKGLVSNRDDLIVVLKECFHKSEEMLGIKINEVVLAIPAYCTEVEMSEGSTTITNEDHLVTHQDLIRAMQAASYNKVNSDMELISIIPTRYKIDNEQIVKNPLNMAANKLSLKAVVITVPKVNVDPFINALDKIGVNVLDIVTTSLGDYEVHKSKNTISSLGAVINIGEETTTVSIFNKGVLMKSEVIELGGVNIDNDIAYIYKITKKDAKEIKEKLGLAVPDMAEASEKISLTDRLGENVVINQKDLCEIIESRLTEILELSKKQMNLLTKRDIEYIIVTGGTTEMGDFNILLDKVFTKSHILGKIEIVGVRNNKYSTVVGITKYFNERLRLKNKEYSVFNEEQLEILSGDHKKVNINENSILGKLFGYFFDN